jgi:hypothetical protein
MKRISVTLLAVIYFAISSGVVVNMHYCMGRLSSVKMQSWSANTCACGKKTEPKKKCCKTELKVVKLEDAQKAAYADFAIHTPVTPLVTEFNLLFAPSYHVQCAIAPSEHSPPLLSEQDTYLRNRVFRI